MAQMLNYMRSQGCSNNLSNYCFETVFKDLEELHLAKEAGTISGKGNTLRKQGMKKVPTVYLDYEYLELLHGIGEKDIRHKEVRQTSLPRKLNDDKSTFRMLMNTGYIPLAKLRKHVMNLPGHTKYRNCRYECSLI